MIDQAAELSYTWVRMLLFNFLIACFTGVHSFLVKPQLLNLIVVSCMIYSECNHIVQTMPRLDLYAI